MSKINAFITEKSAKFVHTVNTTNNQFLKVKLWRNTHIHIEVKLVVVGNKRLSCGSSRNHIKNWSFYFKEPACIKIAANILNNLGTSYEVFADRLIDNEIQVSLAIPT